MLKLLLILFIAILFQACQVNPEVAGAKQVATNNFPGAMLKIGLPANGWKKLGDEIDITLLFPLPITVTNSPYINVQIGSSIRRFYYESGTGTNHLIFRYTVTSADLDTGGITIDDSIELNGGTMTYSPGGSVVENVPTGLDILPSEIKVDGVVPYLNQVTAPAGGNYATGQQLKYHLLFSEKVDVTGTPTFNVLLGSGTVTSKYKSGSGTTNLEFSRLLAVVDSDADGFSTGTLLNLSLISGITITDQAGNAASSTIYSTTSTNVLVNVVQPTILSITPPAAATYTLAQTLDFTVLMSEDVDVTGTPSIPITLNTGTVLATYLIGSGSDTLTYRYTVQTNHIDIDGITLISPMVLNGGTIKNQAATHNAALIYTVPATPTVLVDAATGPYVVTAFKPTNGTYLESRNLDFTLNFNAVVNVTNFPRIPIIIGTTTVYADYLFGAGTRALVFRYTTTTSDSDLDGISLSGPIDLNGGTIEDAGTKPAILSYVPPNTIGILVDGTSPTIPLVSGSGSGNLITGQHLNFSVKFSEVVNIVAPDPTLSITVGLNPQSAIYISGSGTDTLVFRYTVQVADDDTDGVDITSPLLTTGTIKDLRAHDATLAFANVTTTGYVVDGVASTVASFVVPVAPPFAGYKMGDTLDFEVQWSEPTYVTGSPRLVLTVGTSTLYATYLSASSTTTSSIFRYTVLVGHLDTDGIVTTGLQLNGGQLKDAAGNNADYSFVIPSLAAYEIDGVVPFALITAVPANGIYKAGDNLVFTLLWDQPVTVTGAPVLNLIIGSTPVSTSACVFVTGITTIATCTYPILSGQLDTNGITLLSAVSLPGGATIKDLAGNNSYLQINPPDLTGITVDAIVPTIVTAMVTTGDGTYVLNEDIEIEVLWSEPVTIDTTGGTPSISITLDTGGVVLATYVASPNPALVSVFRYTVLTGHADPNGISMAGSVTLNGGTIRDAALNDANPLTFTAPSTTGILVDGITATILSWTPPANGTYKIGDNLDTTVTWSEPVDVDTSGGTPCIFIWTDTWHLACYIDGTTTASLVFRYTVLSGEVTPVTGARLWGTVFLLGGTIQDAATNNAYLTFPPSSVVTYYPLIVVDGIRPTVSSSYSDNITSVSNDNYFKSAHTIEYSINFSERMAITGNPRLTLTIGGVTKYADYFAATSTPLVSPFKVKFRLILDAGSVLLDLDGIDVNTSIDMNGGSIKDLAGNDFTATFAFSEKDYVHYDATIARYHLSNSDYTASATSCGGVDFCITSVKDISGNGKHLTAGTTPGPKFISGTGSYGANLTNVMQFNASSSLSMPALTSVKYVIFVMKTVNNASITAATSTHTLLNRRYYAGWSWQFDPTIKFTSTSSTKSIIMNPTQKMKKNNGVFPVTATATETGPALWAANTNYIFGFELSAATNFSIESIIGGGQFNGQIAEIIFLGTTPAITEAGHIDTMISQLNAIHGAYD